MASLDAIALKHGTDKATGRGRHGFTEIYEPLFQPLRDRPITLLEIGVETGASLRTWEDYFRAGRIVGIDNNPAAAERDVKRATILVGDQENREFLTWVADQYGSFDIVIDDGGHFAVQQLTSLEVLWPRINPGGIYAIEDIHTSYLSEWSGGWRREGTLVEHLKELVDDVHQPWHGHAAALNDLKSLHVYSELVILRRG